MKPATVLRRVLAIMDKGRWIQNSFEAEDRPIGLFARRNKTGRRVNCYCVMGAFDHVIGADNYNESRETQRLFNRPALKALLAATGASRVEDVYAWNDARDRTIGDVRGAVRKAIKLVEKAAT